jgi:hypothetical protein
MVKAISAVLAVEVICLRIFRKVVEPVDSNLLVV